MIGDHAAREAIRTELDTSMLVEAAAGTGKTTALVDRMVQLVAKHRAQPSTIAALTFTLKAAAQLRERFEQALEKTDPLAAKPAPVQEVAPGRNYDLFSRPSPEAAPVAEPRRPRAVAGFIGTTHAFCARLLRERPVEAGLDPEFEEVDEAVARQLSVEFWNRWYETALASGDALVAEAREIGLDRKTLAVTFEKLVEYPDVTQVWHRGARPDLAGLCAAIGALIDEAAGHLPDPVDLEDKFQALIVNLQRLRRSRDLEDDLDAQLQYLEEANHTTRVKPTQYRWPDKKVAKQLGEAYAHYVTTTLRPELQHWQEYVHGVAIELLQPAVETFALERRRSGRLTFQDLLICARDLLRDHPHVRTYFQRRFTHLLVDEFQDTDPLQAEVLFYLTGSDVQEKNWRRLRPRPGSLFIVGDPKQSIYRFRRADITTYLEVKQRMEKVVALSTNFRSGPQLCTFVNGAFGVLFTAADVADGLQAAHIDLMPHRRDEDPDALEEAGVFALESIDDPKADVVAEREAARVSAWIRDAVDAGTHRYSDFLLVSAYRPRLSLYTHALEQRGIPYEVTGSKAFDALGELEMVMPLLKAIAEPDDLVSLVAFLRGPLCGADDDALYRFVQAGGRFQPFREPPAGTDERIVRGLATVRTAIEDSRAVPPAAAIARLFDHIGLVPLSASHERPGTRSGGLLLALSLARDASASGAPFDAIVEQYASLLANPPDIEELDADPVSADAVRLMNLHQVKGLEARVVFLIDPVDDRDFAVDLCVDRSGEESRGHLRVKKSWGKGSLGTPAGWAALEQREGRFNNAQKLRLLYVAATRARSMLVVGYRRTRNGIAGIWRELASRATQPLPDLQPRQASADAGAEAVVRHFEDAQAEIAARFDVARTPSYSVLPITKLAHGDHQQLVRAEEGLGRGMSWGRVLHRLFEAMLRDEALDIELYAENLLKDEERDAAELGEVLKTVAALRGSSLWQRVLAADEKYAEVPFALNVPAQELGLTFTGPTLLHGTIDLVFREGDRWYVIDYKSDATAGRLDALVAYYTPQVEHYARFWQQLTGHETRGGLFFVDGVVERWV